MSHTHYISTQGEPSRETSLLAFADKHLDSLEGVSSDLLRRVGLTKEKVIEMTLVFRPDIRKLLELNELEGLGFTKEILIKMKKFPLRKKAP